MLLGFVLVQLRELDDARELMQRLVASGQPQQGLVASIIIGLIHLAGDDEPAARAAFEQVRAGGNDLIAEFARRCLGILDGLGPRALEDPTAEAFGRALLAMKAADTAAATEHAEQAVSAGDPELSPLALHLKAALLIEQGDYDGALLAFRQAADSGHPYGAPLGHYGVGVALADKEDYAGAAAAFTRAANSGHPEVAPEAAFQLALVHQLQGNTPDALARFREAADSSHQDIAPRAAVRLGELIAAQSPDQARDHFLKAVASGHADTAPEAELLLAWQAALDAADATPDDVAKQIAAADAGFAIGQQTPCFRQMTTSQLTPEGEPGRAG